MLKGALELGMLMNLARLHWKAEGAWGAWITSKSTQVWPPQACHGHALLVGARARRAPRCWCAVSRLQRVERHRGGWGHPLQGCTGGLRAAGWGHPLEGCAGGLCATGEVLFLQHLGHVCVFARARVHAPFLTAFTCTQRRVCAFLADHSLRAIVPMIALPSAWARYEAVLQVQHPLCAHPLHALARCSIRKGSEPFAGGQPPSPCLCLWSYDT
eukprot:1161544-Pelagomonas_calceolata.AAC.3